MISGALRRMWWQPIILSAPLRETQCAQLSAVVQRCDHRQSASPTKPLSAATRQQAAKSRSSPPSRRPPEVNGRGHGRSPRKPLCVLLSPLRPLRETHGTALSALIQRCDYPRVQTTAPHRRSKGPRPPNRPHQLMPRRTHLPLLNVDTA